MRLNSRTNSVRLTFALGASVIAMLAGTPAFAQDEENADDGEIIVTAQFR